MNQPAVGPPGLAGRDGELAEIERSLKRLREGAPQVITVSGEAGIGKTSLLIELRRIADSQGLLALAGRSSQYEAGVPFTAVAEALDDYVQALPPSAVERLGESQLAELAEVLPSLRVPADESPAGLQDERYRSHGAVKALLEQLAAERPVVLALDDLHWADPATVELVGHLLRRPPDGPVALVLSFRSGQLPTPLARALEDAGETQDPVALRLGPLGDDEIREMLGSRIDPGTAAELSRLSGGNPFYLEELVRSGSDLGPGESADSSQDGVWPGSEIPRPIAAALVRELEALPEPARLLAWGAAVAGETLSPELAAEGAGVSEHEALAAIDELLDRDLLRRTDVPRRFRFRHPIVHRGVYEDAKPGWRLAAHGRVAATLASRGASALVRAPHVESSAAPGDAAAVAVLTEAGEAASLRAPAAAAHWYRAALRLLPEDDAGARLSLMIPMAQALGYAGRLEQARATLDEVLFLLGPDELAARGQVAAAAARLDQLMGRHREALELLTNALAKVPDQTGPEATELKVQLAGASFFNGDFDGLRRWVGEALDEARAAGDRATEAALMGSLGAAEYMTGELEAAREHLDEAGRMLAELDDQQVARRLHSLVWQGMTELYLGRFDRADAVFERGISVARSTGHGHVTTLNRIGQAYILLWRGEIAAAARLLDEASEAALLTGNDQFLAWALSAASWAAILAGDIPEALRLGERAMDSTPATPDPVSALAAAHLAEARLEAGEPPEACREQLLAAVGGERIALFERGFKPHVQEILARIELAAGNMDEAEEWAARATEAAAGMGILGRSAEAARARAAVALARGDRERAAAAALEAAELCAEGGLPIEQARSRLLAGRALASVEREQAIEQLELARAALDALGAHRYRDEAAAELRGLGERVARSKRARAEIGEGVAALSPREQQVASLVAEGHTNKAIAAQLFLSEKTIEKHLARIFDKLGVSARAQVAAAIERERV